MRRPCFTFALLACACVLAAPGPARAADTEHEPAPPATGPDVQPDLPDRARDGVTPPPPPEVPPAS
jgi:hypothetical protein